MKKFETELKHFKANKSKLEYLDIANKMMKFGMMNHHLHYRDGYIWAIYEKEMKDSYEYIIVSNHEGITSSMALIFTLEPTEMIDLSNYDYLAGKKIHI